MATGTPIAATSRGAGGGEGLARTYYKSNIYRSIKSNITV